MKAFHQLVVEKKFSFPPGTRVTLIYENEREKEVVTFRPFVFRITNDGSASNVPGVTRIVFEKFDDQGAIVQREFENIKPGESLIAIESE